EDRRRRTHCEFGETEPRGAFGWKSAFHLRNAFRRDQRDNRRALGLIEGRDNRLCPQRFSLALRMVALAGQLYKALCVFSDFAAIWFSVRGDTVARGMFAFLSARHDESSTLQINPTR